MYRFSDFAPVEIGPIMPRVVIPKELGPIRRYGAKPLRIYLAGPVEAHCWRNQFVPGLCNILCNLDPEEYEASSDLTLKMGRHIYVGPFFIACDHRCGHGSTSHGVNAGPSENYCFEGPTRDQVRRRCRAQIDSADLVFAWIDRPEAYGTIWELGYAAAKKKTIVVRWPTGFDISEMWLSLSEDARPVDDIASAFEETVSAPVKVAEPLPVDSPIEALLRDALAPLVDGRFVLKTRHRAGKYRLDFAIWNEKNAWRIAVECDGHAFHEKTKEQAEKDRLRERDLIFEGWTVLRFTGREIHRDAERCARDVLNHCLRLDALQK